jgi:hypothetical protein
MAGITIELRAIPHRNAAITPQMAGITARSLGTSRRITGTAARISRSPARMADITTSAPAHPPRTLTMSLGTLIRAAALVLAAPCLLRAQNSSAPTVPRIDPSIRAVVSGGYWKTDKATGTFRIVETVEGYEELRYRVYVQWLENVGGETRVRLSREIGPLVPEQFSLKDPQLALQDGKWQVIVRAANAPMKQADHSLSFTLGPPGEITPVAAH